MNFNNIGLQLTPKQVLAARRVIVDGPSAYKAWRLALGKAMLGISDARIIFVGDSTNAGLTASAGGVYNRTHVVAMAKVLAGAGFPVNFNAAFGTPNRAGGTSFTTWDPRWTTTGTAWATLSGFSSVGGEALGNSTTTATLKFTPTNPISGAAYAFDSYDVYSCKNTGYATWTTDIGGAALATVNDDTTRGLRVSTVSTGGGAATGFINIQRNGTGGQAYILGIAPRVVATKHLEIFNVSAGSYTSANLISGGSGASDFVARRVIEQMCAAVPSLVIVDIGINDWRTLTYSSTYQTNLETMVDGYIANGASVVLCKPVPSQIGYSAFVTQANMDAYRAAIDTVAEARGLLVYDKAARFESYTVGNAAGWYSDGLHPTQGAYAQMGLDLAAIVAGW